MPSFKLIYTKEIVILTGVIVCVCVLCCMCNSVIETNKIEVFVKLVIFKCHF